jgi:hypothetical protein
MGFFVQLLELLAVFLPDPLELGLFTLALFNLWCITKTLHVAGTLNTDTGLGISLAIGYLVTIAINIFETPQAPARSTITISCAPGSSVEQAGRESLSCTRKAQPAGREGAVIEP